MFIKQISLFIENKPGKLSAVTRLLGDAGIDIRALSVADTRDFGILRLIVNDPDKALAVLKEADIPSSVTNVIGVGAEDKPGSLAAIMERLYGANISVEYMYAFLTKTDKACMIIRVDSNEKALEALREGGFTILEPEDVYTM